MNISLLIPALTTAVSVGLGCGTCCSPIISTFLSTYVMSHSGGVKKGVLSFASFFFGKMVSVSLLCMAAALVSRQFISDSGYIGSFNLRLFSQTAMSVIGVVLAARWFLELKKQKKCGGCKECKKNGWKVRVCANACCRADLWHDALCPSFTDDWILFYPSGFFGGGDWRCL